MLNSKNSLMKFLSALMAATLIFTFLPLNALSVFAEGEEEEKGLGYKGDDCYSVIVTEKRGTSHTDKKTYSFTGKNAEGEDEFREVVVDDLYDTPVKKAHVTITGIGNNADGSKNTFFGEDYTDDDGRAGIKLKDYYLAHLRNGEWDSELQFEVRVEKEKTGYYVSNTYKIKPNNRWDGVYWALSVPVECTDLSNKLDNIAGITNNGSYVFNYELDDENNPVVRKASDCFTLSEDLGLTATYTDGKEPTFTKASATPYEFSVSFQGEGYTDGDDDADDIFVRDFKLTINPIERGSYKFNETDVKITFNTDGTPTTYQQIPICIDTEEPATPIEYKSNNTSVADVDTDGVVTFAKTGKVKITATMPASTNYIEKTVSYDIEAKKRVPISFAKGTVSEPYSENMNYQMKVDVDTTGLDSPKVTYSIKSNTTSQTVYVDSNGRVYNIKSFGVIVVEAKLTAKDCYDATATYTLKVGLAQHTLAIKPDQEFVFGEKYPIFNEPSTSTPVIHDESDKEWYKIFKNEDDGKFYLEVTAGSVNYKIKSITADSDERYDTFSQDFTEYISGTTARAEQTVDFLYKPSVTLVTGSTVYLLTLTGEYHCDDDDVQITATWSDSTYYVVNKEAKKYTGTTFPQDYYVFITFNSRNYNEGTCHISVVFPGNEDYKDKPIEMDLILKNSTEFTTDYVLVNSKGDYPNGANTFFTEDVTVKPVYADKLFDLNNTLVDSYTLTESKIYPARENVVFFKDSTDQSNRGKIQEIKIDKDAPTFNIDISGQTASEELFMRLLLGGDILAVYSANQAIVTITANDKLSGIDKIKYDIGDGEIVLDNLVGDTYEIQEKTFFKPNQDVIGSFVIPADKRVNLRIWIYDVAGNYITTVGEGNDPFVNSTLINYKDAPVTNNDNQQIDIITDTIKPVVTVNFDDLVPENTNFFKTDRAATINIDEENYFLDDLTINITKNGTLLSTESDDYKKIVKVDEKENKKIYLEFTDDGHYELEIYCTDPAQNVGKATYTGKACTDFYIDKTSLSLLFNLF